MSRDRMPTLDANDFDAAQRAAVEEFESVRGIRLMGPFVPLLRSPELMKRARSMGDYLRYESALPQRLRELLILLTAREWSQQTEWSIHCPPALEAGLDPATIAAIADGRRPDALADDEAVLYELFVELQRNRCVSDATYDRAVARFGERAVVDAVGIIGYYTLLAMVMNVARTTPPPSEGPPLPSLPG